MTHLARIASRVIGCPLLLRPQAAETVFNVVTGRIASGPFDGTRIRKEGSYALARKVGNVAEIRVEGELVNKGAWVDAESGLTSYEGLNAQILEVDADPEINAIALDIDSPGGEAGGMWSIAETIRGVSKPVVAVVNDMACSAAYGIASACDEIVVTPTSTVGSIGVVLVHFDQSEALKEQGVAPTIIHAGAHKADGHPFGPLPDAVREDLQRHVLTIYDRFLETVELGRGARLTADMARTTEARVFLGEEAIKEGLADRLGTLEGVLSDLNAGRPARTQSSKKGAKMADTNDTVTRAEHERVVEAARQDGIKAGVAEENDRVKAILGSEAAQANPTAAAKMAMRTDVSSETAIDLMGDLKPEQAASSVPPIGQRDTGPEIGASATDTPKKGAKLGDYTKKRRR